jgi:5-methyltetrahydropteroyltriglutamate--homocysteine methyltransferase
MCFFSAPLIEHPGLVAERLVRYASLVGRDRVMAGVDCGFGTFAGRVQVDSKIVWDGVDFKVNTTN